VGRDTLIESPKDIMHCWYLSLLHISEPTRSLYTASSVFCLQKNN